MNTPFNKILDTTPLYTYDDVLISPSFTSVVSRRDVDLSGSFLGKTYDLPVISANMDTVTESKMARYMLGIGAEACLHRFCSIEQGVEMLRQSGVDGKYPMVSIGLGQQELDRAVALAAEGASAICIDVANGASLEVVKQYLAVKNTIPNIPVVVGNFATGRSVADFEYHTGNTKAPDAYKVGVGPGSACTTRIKTGVGIPQLSAVMSVRSYTDRVIADGGCKTPGDVAKALAAGAKLVMLGGMLAGTYEAPGDVKDVGGQFYKVYRGSASRSSYEKQGKTATWRAVEGDEFLVPFKGPAETIIQDIEGGVRSTCTYVGAKNLSELFEKARFVVVTSNGVKESGSHGKTI